MELEFAGFNNERDEAKALLSSRKKDRGVAKYLQKHPIQIVVL